MRQLSKEMKPVSYYIKNGSLSVLLLNIILLISAQNTNAQKDITNEDYNAFSVQAHVKNMHLWHGGVVHPGAMIATSLEYNSKNEKFTFGLWGGASFSTIDVNNITTGRN
ncbi:hypothetical protein OEG92_08705 [Polaribacter sejongensis]|uniref:hypothetical protein n=1 Tax=Polaribacter sejongensis TaxID=985043 RepID=UPI0035A657FC